MKRAMDLVLTVPALLLLAPVMLAVAAAVHLRLGNPVIFRQLRPGLQGQPFTLFKFRTMTEHLDGSGKPMPDSQRLTPLGRFLRRTSLDELPQLWNVLKGEMSLVGPRPLLMEYLPHYTQTQARRHEVRPGLTGWAQIHGRNATTWEARLAQDVWYVDHRSLGLDLKILWRTLTGLGRGVEAPGHATMPRFDGKD